MEPNDISTTSEFNPNNRINRRNIFLLAFVILVGGLLLPMGVIRAAAASMPWLLWNTWIRSG